MRLINWFGDGIEAGNYLLIVDGVASLTSVFEFHEKLIGGRYRVVGFTGKSPLIHDSLYA
ncbi:hypothetical protein [Haladaptatus sp. AB643]|uniref:hypothetical protein n=1 Tax=Haladaptatus sp. AB643 TaxID=2934174 RepID=UPI00209C2299|nr:hypothetical protein [Haladaptatus sp. AB643]